MTDNNGNLYLELTYVTDDWEDEKGVKRVNYRIIDSETAVIRGNRYTRR